MTAPGLHELPELPLAASPSYRALGERVAGGLEDGDPAQHVAVFAEHVAELAACGATDEFDAVFATVESVLQQADAVVQRHVGRFFLGMLQLAARRRGVPLERFEVWLGPRAREEWAAASELHAAVRAAYAEHYHLPGR